MNNRKQIHRIKVIEFSKCAAFISFAMDLISPLLFYVQFYGAAAGMHILALTPTNKRNWKKVTVKPAKYGFQHLIVRLDVRAIVYAFHKKVKIITSLRAHFRSFVCIKPEN